MGMLHIILKVGHPKIISTQISEQKILMWFLSHNIPKRNKLAEEISQTNPEYMSYGKIMLIILFMKYEYSWRRGTAWHFFFSNIGKNIIFLEKKPIAYDFIVMFPLNAPHIIIWSRDTLYMKKRCKWYRRIVWKCLGNSGTFHTPDIPTLPLKWHRALKSVKTITINLLQEPTESSILNKYQVELFYRKS